MVGETLFTWETLATLAGASLLTFFVVQYTKNLIDRVVEAPTDIYAVVVGAITLFLAALAQGAEVCWQTAVLSLANGFLVAAAAGQMYNKVINPPGQIVKDTEAEE